MVRKHKKIKGTEEEDDEKGDKDMWVNGGILDLDTDEEDLKPDRPSTIARKEQFLKLFPKCRLIIMVTCREMRMSQDTFYRWYNDDEEFAKKIDKARVHVNQRVRDLLMKKIEEGETRAITYYLDRKDPEYKPTSKTEVVTGSKTLEDILKADEDKINGDNTNKTSGDNLEGGQNSAGSEVPIGKTTEDQGQEGKADAVPPEQDTSVLLEEKDKTQSDSQGAPEGNIENNRRRPIDRLRTKRD